MRACGPATSDSPLLLPISESHTGRRASRHANSDVARDTPCGRSGCSLVGTGNWNSRAAALDGQPGADLPVLRDGDKRRWTVAETAGRVAVQTAGLGHC